jgi:hypothetical protein
MHLSRSVALVASLSLAACGAMVTPNDGSTDAPITETHVDDVPIVDAHDVVSEEIDPDVMPPVDVVDVVDVPRTCSFEGASNVYITYVGPGDQPLDCSGTRPPTPGTPGEIVVRHAAVVSAVDDEMGSHVTLDFCSPAADCLPQLGTLTIRSNDFQLASAPNALQPGQYVQIRSRATWSWGCTMEIEIANAPTWDGDTNRIRSDSAVLAAAASGVSHAMEGSPFEVSRQSIGCEMMGPNCGGGPPEVFALAFQGHCNTCIRDPDPVVVEQGRMGVFDVNGLSYSGFNARSMNSGACDDYWSYAWTAREIWLE